MNQSDHEFPAQRPPRVAPLLRVAGLGGRPRLVYSRAAHVPLREPAAAAPMTGVGQVVHEMRNFLAPMPQALEILRRQAGSDALAARAIDLMQRQADGLARLVADLLDVSRAAGGKLLLVRERCALQDIARRAIDMCAPAAHARSQRLVLEPDGAPAMLDADPMRLAQAVSNLVFNAVRHTPEGGAIRVQVGTEAGKGVLRVRDEGCGMRPELCACAFEFGTQASNGAGGGLGIGLYLVRSIVELHGGTVDAWSAGPGEGSTFTIRLPLALDAARGARVA